MNPSDPIVPDCPELQTMNTSLGKLSFRSGGKGEAIIFLHGLLGAAEAWAFQFAALTPAYHVIAWNAPGYGPSTLIPATIDAYEQSLHELIQTCGHDRVSLVGHSMGGTVASRYAARHPNKINRLILSCTHPGYAAPDSAPVPEKLQKRLREL